MATTFTTDLDYYSEYFQFRFVQLDHRGGFCDCWAVANLTVTLPNGQATELSYVAHFSKVIITDHLNYLS